MKPERVVHNGWLQVLEVDFHGRTHEIVVTTDAVAVLIYVRDMDSVVFVKQERPVARSKENPEGYLLELPAGRFDRALGIRQLIIAEAQEEAGVKIEFDHIYILNGGKPMYLAPGVLRESLYLAYAEVDSSQIDLTRESFGEKGKEYTERVLVKVDDLPDMQFDCMTTLAAVGWFLRKRGESDVQQIQT